MQWEVSSLIYCELAQSPLLLLSLRQPNIFQPDEHFSELKKNKTNSITVVKKHENNVIGGSKGVPGTQAPLWVQFLSFSCSFRQKSCQIISFLREMYGLAPPGLENTGSANEYSHFYVGLFFSRKLNWYSWDKVTTICKPYISILTLVNKRYW